jgi:dihydrofolate reductase
MRTLASFLMVSLDGYFEAADPEDFGWQTVDEEFNQFAVQQLDASECLLFGRVTFQGMASYWPTRNAIENDPEVASRMNQTLKIVISRSLDRLEPEWNNTRLIIEDVHSELSSLKQQPGKDLLVLGSSVLTASLIDMGLLDQLRIIVNPVVLGEGRSVLGTTKQRAKLKLLENRTFRSGNVLLTYEPQRH